MFYRIKKRKSHSPYVHNGKLSVRYARKQNVNSQFAVSATFPLRRRQFQARGIDRGGLHTAMRMGERRGGFGMSGEMYGLQRLAAGRTKKEECLVPETRRARIAPPKAAGSVVKKCCFAISAGIINVEAVETARSPCFTSRHILPGHRMRYAAVKHRLFRRRHIPGEGSRQNAQARAACLRPIGKDLTFAVAKFSSQALPPVCFARNGTDGAVPFGIGYRLWPDARG